MAQDRNIFPSGNFGRRAFLGGAAAVGGAFVLDRSGLLSVPDYLFGSKNLNPERVKANIGNYLAGVVDKHPDVAQFARDFAGKIAGLGAGEAFADELIAKEGFYLKITQNDGTARPIPIKIARDYFNAMVADGFKVTAIWGQAPNGEYIGYIDGAPEFVSQLKQVNPNTAVILVVGPGEKPKPERVPSLDREAAALLLPLVNEARKKYGGLAPYVPNARLQAAAEKYAKVVFDAFDGSSPYGQIGKNPHDLDGHAWDRAMREGYPTNQVGENIGGERGGFGVGLIVDSWLGSTTGHREVLLDTKFGFKGAGFGVYRDRIAAVFVGDFGNPGR